MGRMTAEERRHIQKVAAMDCIICDSSPVTIHHCGTYMGGGRNHMRVLPLCWPCHLGPEGIDGKKMAKRVWESKYGTEEHLLELVAEKLSDTSY